MIKRKIRSFIRTFFDQPQPWHMAELCGRSFRVRAGTIRDQVDYDDAWLLACAKRSEVIYDIGANVGQSAFIMLLNSSLKKLVLIDPNPVALSVAAENLIHNQLTEKIRFICSFVGETDNQQVRLWTVGTGAAGSIYEGHAKTAAKKNSSLMVPTVTLDSLTKQLDIYPDFIKIDVEGAENLVLDGGKNYVKEYRPSIFVEMHHQPELTMSQNAEKIISWCSEVGYDAWYLKDKIKLETPDQISHRGRCHLLLLHGTCTFPDWLKNIDQSADLPKSISSVF